jgi:hypothetical protein
MNLARVAHHKEITEVPAPHQVRYGLLQRVEIHEVYRKVQLVQKLAPVQP